MKEFFSERKKNVNLILHCKCLRASKVFKIYPAISTQKYCYTNLSQTPIEGSCAGLDISVP